MPPRSAAALAEPLPSTSFVPATFLAWVPSLKLILVFPTNEQGKLPFLLSSDFSVRSPMICDDKWLAQDGDLSEPYRPKQISGKPNL